MPSSAPTSLRPGQLIANRFRLVRLLGSGGMGSVWVAWHTTLNVEVALKFIDSGAGNQEQLQARFVHEAHAAAKIKSPHVVSIIDLGTDAYGGRPYIAMELLNGCTLADRIEQDVTLPINEVVGIVLQVCRGLAKAHAAGVVHRDLKPENIFLCDEDDGVLVKILDFGIAKADSPIGSASHHTGTGQLIGTPTYMSPEQALGKRHIDNRSDLYSLAIVAYRCLIGRPPFELEGLGELIVAISTQQIPPLTSLQANLPGSVDAWFERATRKDPGQRFASAREMGEAFALACGISVPNALSSVSRARSDESGVSRSASANAVTPGELISLPTAGGASSPDFAANVSPKPLTPPSIPLLSDSIVTLIDDGTSSLKLPSTQMSATSTDPGGERRGVSVTRVTAASAVLAAFAAAAIAAVLLFRHPARAPATEVAATPATPATPVTPALPEVTPAPHSTGAGSPTAADASPAPIAKSARPAEVRPRSVQSRRPSRARAGEGAARNTKGEKPEKFDYGL